jgi:sugar phosphate isomerase/epimerase
VADIDPADQLVASFFTLTGSGFAEPPVHGFAERCRAASDAGFTGIGLHTADLARAHAAGLDDAAMRAVLADTGLSLVEIEFLGGWSFDSDTAELDSTLATIEHIADAFGGRHVSCGEFRTAPESGLDPDAAAAALGALAKRLDARGLRIAVEAFPWSAIPDVSTAIDLLRRSGSASAGLMVDVWHFFNGGADPDDLADLPAGGIAAVQLNDGPRVHEDFLGHARAARMLPGEGDLDVVGLVGAVLATGFTGPWCVEATTPELRALPLDERARRAAGAAERILDAARG